MTHDIDSLTPFNGMNVVESKASTEMMVIGVGGGGSNAVKYMYNQCQIKGIRYVVCNTDKQALNDSGVPTQLLLGPTVTMGGGAGNMPEVARAAAEESREDIAQLFKSEPSPNMVFITAGMGGGTGTGAAPVVASVAKELGILTVGIVTLPFIFEGFSKISKALTYIEEMRKHVDALLIINNERLREIYPDLAFINAFAHADDVLATAAGSIIEIIVKNGYVNCDFRDVRTTLLDGGTAIISTGYGEGSNRVTAAIEDAIRSPLLKNTDIYTSKKLLIIIYLSPDEKEQMTLAESDELTTFTAKFVNSPDVITGIYFDETIGSKMKISILASGFEASESSPTTMQQEQVKAKPATNEADVNNNRMIQMYGQEALREMERNRWQIVILTPEQMTNEALLDFFDSEPTYSRTPDFRQRLQNVGNQPIVEESEQPVTNNMRTINFGD